MLPERLQHHATSKMLHEKFSRIQISSSNMLQHTATEWPNICNMLCPTMLQDVALKCCVRLARPLVVISSKQREGSHSLISFLFSADCNHSFCLPCIRKWRNTSHSSETKIVRYNATRTTMKSKLDKRRNIVNRGEWFGSSANIKGANKYAKI